MKNISRQMLPWLMLGALVAAGCASDSPRRPAAGPDMTTEAPYTKSGLKTLAILPFSGFFEGETEASESAGKHLAAVLTTELLSTGRAPELVEREHIHPLIEEIELSENAVVDPASTLQKGRLLGARVMAFGSFAVLGPNVRIDVRIVDVETGETVLAEFVRGKKSDLFTLQHDLAHRLAAGFEDRLRTEPRKKTPKPAACDPKTAPPPDRRKPLLLLIAGGDGSRGTVARDAESMLQSALTPCYDIQTPDDVPEADQNRTIPALSGKTTAIRALARLMKAEYAVYGRIESESYPLKIYGLSMTKAVTTLTCRIYHQGRAERIHRAVFNGMRRFPEAALQVGLQRLAGETSRRIVAAIQAADRSPSLSRMREQTETTVENTARIPDAVQTPPRLRIQRPVLGRRGEAVIMKSDATLRGVIENYRRTDRLTVNGKQVEVGPGGRFETVVSPEPGANAFFVEVTGERGRYAEKECFIHRPPDRTPPFVSVVEPPVGKGIGVMAGKLRGPLTVAGYAEDLGKVVSVSVNGVPARIDDEGRFTASVSPETAPEGWVRIRAEDDSGNITRKRFQMIKGGEDSKIRLVAARREKPVLWALCVGISRYESAVADLRFAAKDARLLAATLEQQAGKLFSEVHAALLIDEAATRESVLSAMSGHLNRAAPEDVVFIFLSGHGLRHQGTDTYYFVPHDADPETILSRGLGMYSFDRALNMIAENVGKVIVVVDTCHAGAMRIGFKSWDGGVDLAKTLRRAKGRFVLASAKSGEISVEDERFQLPGSHPPGHGVFAYGLIRGLMGEANLDGDHYISVTELFRYVSRRVPRLTEGRQHPYLRSEGEDIPFVLLR